MKPICLEMSAFGPYAEVQLVDFREALDAGLFGIYGPTGSGKSSIFSAITFALFGEAAKKEQPIWTLRSGHASAERLTEVALVFEIGAKRYLVRRQPDQLRPKARGEGETGHPHSAWLFDVSDVEVDSIDMQGCGIVLAERKVSRVTELVRELLGYGSDQFRQIVLLPQGRFERFLSANSAERLTILRELFDVSLYRRITDRLKDEAAAARRAVSDGYRLHGQRLHAEGFASADELEAGIAARGDEAAVLAVEAAARDAAMTSAEQALTQGQAIEARFVESEQAQHALKLLQADQARIEIARRKRDNAQLARRAADVHAAIDVAERRREDADRLLQQALRDAEATAAAYLEAETQLKQAVARGQEIEGYQRRTDDAARHRQALRDAQDLKIVAERASMVSSEADSAAKGAAAARDQLQEAQTEVEATLATAQHDAVQRAQLRQKHAALDTRLRGARAHRQANADLASARARRGEAELIAGRATEAYGMAERRAVEREAAFIAAQSSILALRLVEGEACPVCGASDHPLPAHAEGDPHQLEAEWKAAQAQLAQAARAQQQALVDQASVESLIAERAAQLGKLAVPDSDPETLEAEFSAIDNALGDLGEALDLAELERRLTSLKGELREAKTQAEDSETSRNRASTAEALARRSYEDQIAEVPEPFRDPHALAEELETLLTLIAERKLALASAQEAMQEATAARAAKEAAHAGAKTACADALAHVAEASERFAVRLGEVGISTDQYATYAEDIPRIDALSEAVDGHERALRQAEGAAAQAATLLADVERPQLALLRDTRESARDSATAARQAAAAAGEQHRGLVRLKDELAAELARLAQLETDTGPLRTLAEAFSGQNETNTALETFAIGTMFDAVLEAANLRLEPMTSGRYRLERDSETSGGRARRGLDIRVDDIQTGGTRDLTTLSGGESFIAALALALGLSDIVEASQGAIRLDTIFIDEGFGSLDTENDSGTLELVLQVLQNIVGQRRAVGLISHVPLVQQAVPNGFVISKGVAGSTIEKRSI